MTDEGHVPLGLGLQLYGLATIFIFHTFFSSPSMVESLLHSKVQPLTPGMAGGEKTEKKIRRKKYVLFESVY